MAVSYTHLDVYKRQEVRFEEINCEDADYLIIAFGSMARIGQKAMELAREEGSSPPAPCPMVTEYC